MMSLTLCWWFWAVMLQTLTYQIRSDHQQNYKNYTTPLGIDKSLGMAEIEPCICQPLFSSMSLSLSLSHSHSIWNGKKLNSIGKINKSDYHLWFMLYWSCISNDLLLMNWRQWLRINLSHHLFNISFSPSWFCSQSLQRPATAACAARQLSTFFFSFNIFFGWNFYYIYRFLSTVLSVCLFLKCSLILA